MGLKWTDSQDIAIELADQHPDTDPLAISFPDLHQKICALAEFDDNPEHSGEKILEAIQMLWIEEQD